MTGAVVVPVFLSPKECADAIALFPPVAAAGVIDSKVSRKGRASFLPGEASDWLHGRLVELLVRVNERHFRFELGGSEPPQLAEYGPGDGYDHHLDLGPGPAALRKLSASVQLSAPEDYDGGELELWNTAPVERAQGAAVVFPSYLVHRVAPVTRGLRRSLVIWATGRTSFR